MGDAEKEAVDAGASIIVTGTAIENNPNNIQAITKEIHWKIND